MKIALIDDDATTNFINEIKLKKRIPSCEVFSFENGKKAIEFLKKGNKIDLALLDLNMPVMNGMQFLTAHQKLDNSLKIKKIVLFIEEKVASKFKNDNSIYLAIRKPLGEKKMDIIFQPISKINVQITQGLSPEILKQALQIFVKNTKFDLQELNAHFQKGEFISVQKLAHKLIGSSGSVGLMDFSEIANKIESNKEWEIKGKKLILNLNKEFSEILELLKSEYGI